MILTTKLADKLLNSEFIKKSYPMIDNIKTHVVWDGDEENPLYTLFIGVNLNDPSVTSENLYEKGLDPYTLIRNYVKILLKIAGFNLRDIIQIDVLIRNSNGEIVYG